MTTKLLSCPTLAIVLAAAAGAQTAQPAKTAILQVQNGILSTAEGHQAFAALESKFAARKAELEKKQNEIATLQEQLRKGSATMSEDSQRKLAREIDRKTKTFTYEGESTQTDYEQEQADTAQMLAQKFRAVVDKYARDHGFGLVLDVSNPQTPAFWWANAMDITNEVVRAYDAAYPVSATSGPSNGK
jgi:outer membrane protein